MKRNRLTQRLAKKNFKADEASPETSIDLGKERPYHKMDEYHTFEPSLNHWEPDMRHEWKKDNEPGQREPTGHGVVRMAGLYVIAKRAAKLAEALLGEGATDEQIEAQTNDFMRMGGKALSASLKRLAEADLNTVDEEQEKNAEDEAPAESPVACDEKKAEDETTAPAAPVADETAVPSETAPVAEEEEEVTVEAPAPVDADDEDGNIEVNDELIPADIDFDEPADDSDISADAELENCFEVADDVEEVEAPAETTVARKAGIKHLSGQPTLVRCASKKDANELASLWEKWEKPDVR